MVNKIILSVVIPFYNGINDVVELVGHLSSGDSRYEIVLVNDGSTVCTVEELSAKFEDFNNVRLVSYNENKGTSTARNEGILAARGDYIWMIDADDFVEQADVVRIVEWAEVERERERVFDALLFAWTSEPNSQKDGQPIQAIELSKDEALRLVYGDGHVWNKIFRRQAIVDYNIRFNNQLFWAEDQLFCAQFLASSTGKLYSTSAVLYCYIKSDTSFTSLKKVDKKHLTLIDSKYLLLELARSLQIEGLVEIAHVSMVSSVLMLLFRLIKQRPEGWCENWKKYYGMISASRKSYLGNQAILPKYRMFLVVCPIIDFVLRSTKDGMA